MALHKHRGAAKVAARKRLQRAEGLQPAARLAAETAQESKASKGKAAVGGKKKVKRK